MEASENLVQLSDSKPLLNDENSWKCWSTLNVVVLGDTGVGKSAVLNSLIGHPVLPTGENGATRAPICIDLDRDEHLSDKTILQQIDSKTQSVTASDLRHSLQDKLGKISRMSRDEIYLKLKTSTAPPLKLIDLPGVEKWNPDHSLNEYAQHNDAILMVIITAAQAPDVSSAKALRIAKKYDEKRTRTIGVISKIDQASEDPKVLAACQALLLGQGPRSATNIPWVALPGQSPSIAYAQLVKTESNNSLETAWRAESENLKSILTGAPQNKLGRLALVETLAYHFLSLLAGKASPVIQNECRRTQDSESGESSLVDGIDVFERALDEKCGHIQGVGQVVRSVTPDVLSKYFDPSQQWQEQIKEEIKQQVHLQVNEQMQRMQQDFQRQLEQMRRDFQRHGKSD